MSIDQSLTWIANAISAETPADPELTAMFNIFFHNEHLSRVRAIASLAFDAVAPIDRANKFLINFVNSVIEAFGRSEMDAANAKFIAQSMLTSKRVVVLVLISDVHSRDVATVRSDDLRTSRDYLIGWYPDYQRAGQYPDKFRPWLARFNRCTFEEAVVILATIMYDVRESDTADVTVIKAILYSFSQLTTVSEGAFTEDDDEDDPPLEQKVIKDMCQRILSAL